MRCSWLRVGDVEVSFCTGHRRSAIPFSPVAGAILPASLVPKRGGCSAAAGLLGRGWPPIHRRQHEGATLMHKIGLAVLLVTPMILGACNRQPPPPPAPVMTASEAACAARAAEIAGVDAATVTVVPTASTKSGATIYTASVNGTSYTCVVEIDNTVSTFEVMEFAG
jgi:hypothetical protein